MKKAEIALRVNRLLSGKRSVEDLNRIFNWLRFRSRGIPAIREVGDFAAHERRDQGITWARAKDMFHNAKIFMGNVDAHRKGIDFETSLAGLRDGLSASLRLIGPSRVKTELGIGMKAAEKHLADAMDALNLYSGGKWVQATDTPWTPQQRRVVEFATSRFSPKAVFNQDELIDGLYETLLSDGLIVPENREALYCQGDYIAIYVVTVMHLCDVDLGSGGFARLRAGVDQQGKVVVAAEMSLFPRLQIATSMFSTNCAARDWCARSIKRDSVIFTFMMPLELDSKWRLRPVS